ncbi:hypothetical protein DUI87_25045 [Hirundo rustica rustica]|uniref:Uncharacterized protein n=1 Tax=Hirundo rustica rustica TaxID=333673 RepID=A0A3M0JV71_HIRRU|nr:hypothetical protein DUI87_25045 [Hirundo rustica rustica]
MSMATVKFVCMLNSLLPKLGLDKGYFHAGQKKLAEQKDSATYFPVPYDLPPEQYGSKVCQPPGGKDIERIPLLRDGLIK